MTTTISRDFSRGTGTLYAVNVDDGTRTALHTFEKGVIPDIGMVSQLSDGKFYGVNLETGTLLCYDVATDTETVVTDAFAQYAVSVVHDWAKEQPDAPPEQNALEQAVRPVSYATNNWGTQVVGDWLLLLCYDTSVSPQTPLKFAYNLKTGETKQVTFTDGYNGAEYAMAVHALTPHGLLVTQEHRSVPLDTLTPEVRGNKMAAEYEVFGLIDLDDFVNNVPNFRTIQPVHYGA